MTAKRVAVPVADYDRMRARAEYAEAREVRAIEMVKTLVARREHVGGFAPNDEQAELWEARSLIAEVER